MASTIVLITGANGGVGFATAKVIASTSEAFHVIMAGRSLEKVRKAMSELEHAGVKGSLSAVQLDVTDDNSIERAVKAVQDQHERLDVLVNNAGVGAMDPDVKTRFHLCLETNVLGPALVAAAFRPLLLNSHKPYSIYVSSEVGSLALASEPDPPHWPALPNEEAYRASKAALNMVAVMEKKHFGPKGLNVFAMNPGLVVSNLRGTNDEARSGGGNAGDPSESGQLVLSIIQGERDADAGRLVSRDGVLPW
ncbi:hypothetical protein LTR22_026548 [Elasticomyces elasticus]|nr:hypothetical protein LTR22_026548 [Elasticomyces elasticus]